MAKHRRRKSKKVARVAKVKTGSRSCSIGRSKGGFALKCPGVAPIGIKIAFSNRYRTGSAKIARAAASKKGAGSAVVSSSGTATPAAGPAAEPSWLRNARALVGG
jgi:hypothetical protein